MRLTPGAIEELAETVGNVLVWVAVFGVLALSGIALASTIRRLQQRRRSARAREALFVGRWGVFGPELYLVGKRVRRLLGPQACDQPSGIALAFARRMLSEVMRGRPSAQRAQAFAAARLEPIPPDGFVLSTADVKAWLARRV